MSVCMYVRCVLKTAPNVTIVTVSRLTSLYVKIIEHVNHEHNVAVNVLEIGWQQIFTCSESHLSVSNHSRYETNYLYITDSTLYKC